MSGNTSVDYDDPPTEMAEVAVDELTDDLLDAINRPKQSTVDERGSDGLMSPLSLPGFGEECHDDTLIYYCTHCGSTVEMSHTCYKSECPDCAPMWDIDKAENGVARLQTVAKRMSGKMGGVSIKKHHLVMSPPEDWVLEAANPIDKTFDVIGDIMDLLNVEGLRFYHGWRGRDGDDLDAWRGRLFQGRGFENDVRHELTPGPHFHIICAGPYVPGGEVTKRIEEETGWLIKRVTKGGDESSCNKSLPTMQDVAHAMTYCLSHTSIRMGEGDDNNNAQYRPHGQLWHDHKKVTVYDNTRRKAEHAVREAAPKTLGVNRNNLRCGTPLPSDEQPDESVDPSKSFDDYADSGDGDTANGNDTDHDHADDHDHDGESACNAPIKPIWEAEDLLEDEQWVEDATYSDQLRRAFEEWESQGDYDNPPPSPMVDAFV
ncbi:hypothetical protein [Halonotius pteroides]|uniref:Replication protein n=1 Tax=Halonotius pteroides TaxID=268735 RepID=A0A3A6PWZ6_9EURY|nr:hypothetical protein [Halonotius pteroides]RJX47523.1 hypothetical protein DP106_14715 [Halonotius pteroides]